MRRSRRLRPVVDLAVARERDAAVRLGEAAGEAAQARARLRELEAYRSEYARQLEQRVFVSAQLSQARAFLASLNRAIVQQAQRLHLAERREADCRTEWLHLRGRRRALGKVVERYARAEVAARERREQRDADERSGRRPAKAGDG